MKKNSAHARAVPTEADARVGRSDLDKLGVLHQILAALNDSMVSAGRIAAHAAQLGPLQARITRRFAERFPARTVPPLAEQIAVIGNRELEGVLLALLEDLTVLNAELRASEPPPGACLARSQSNVPSTSQRPARS